MGVKTSRECDHTSHIANARAPEHADEFAGRTAIVADWYNISQGTIVVLYDLIEDIHQAVGGRATAEHHDFSRSDSHCFEVK